MVRKKQSVKKIFRGSDSKKGACPVVYARVPQELKTSIKEFMKDKTFPHPYDPTQKCSFDFEQDFVEYVLRAVVRMDKQMWDLFTHINRSSFPACFPKLKED